MAVYFGGSGHAIRFGTANILANRRSALITINNPLTSTLGAPSTLAMYPIDSDSIGSRLRIAREARGLSASALSMSMDPSPGRAWASFVENGRIASPSVETIRNAATTLHVSFEWLATGNGEMEAA